jgi:ankyrin repeat protein
MTLMRLKGREGEGKVQETLANIDKFNIDAFPDGETTGHLTLLMQSVALNNFGAFEALLARGADPTKTNRRGINVLHLIAKKPNAVKIADLCLKHVREQDKSTFINNCTDIGWSVLIQACSTTDNDAFVEWLLNNGATIDHAMTSGWTAAHAAAFNVNKKVLSLLLKKGASRTILATKRDVEPYKDLKPLDVAKNTEMKSLFVLS